MNRFNLFVLPLTVFLFANLLVVRPAVAAIMFEVPDQNLPYSEDGFDFVTGGGGSFSVDWGIDSGTLLVEVSDGQAFSTMTRNGGGTFDLFSADYSYTGNDTGAFDDWFIRSNLGDKVVLDSLATSGSLDLNWTGVTSVDFVAFEPNGDIPGHSIRIDNIVIPEPSTLALTTLGLLGVGCCRRKRA